MKLWRCDGCPLVGNEHQLAAHIEKMTRNADGSLKEPWEVTCTGYMLVGGKAYLAWERGVHPMTTLLEDISLALLIHEERNKE